MTPPAPQPPPDRAAIVRQLVGLALMVLSAAGTIAAAACWDWRAGLAVSAVEAGGLGYFLATEQV